MPQTAAQKAACKKYRDSHKEKTALQHKMYYELHKEEIKTKRRAKYQINKEFEKQRALERRNKNIEAARKSYTKWAKSNRQHINTKYKIRINNDPWFKIRTRLSNKLSKCIKGKYKTFDTLDLLGCSIDEFKKYLESKFQSGMSWDNYSKSGWHIDHIKPCALFDLTNIEEQKECFHYSNMQPMWAIENIKKGKKYNG